MIIFTWISREPKLHVKFTWKNSREFHFYCSIHMKNFTWNSHEFHVKFTCGDFACVTPPPPKSWCCTTRPGHSPQHDDTLYNGWLVSEWTHDSSANIILTQSCIRICRWGVLYASLAIWCRSISKGFHRETSCFYFRADNFAQVIDWSVIVPDSYEWSHLLSGNDFLIAKI